MNPPSGAFDGTFVIPGEATALHQPTEGSFYYPTPRYHFKTLSCIRSLYYFHLQFRPQLLHILGKILTAIASINPELSKPAVLHQGIVQQLLGALPLWTVGWRNMNCQDMSERIDHDEPLSPLGLFARVVTGFRRQPRRAHGLTIKDRGSRPTVSTFAFSSKGPKAIVDSSQDPFPRPGRKDMEDRFVRRKGLGKQMPMAPRLGNIQDGIDHRSEIRARPTRACRLWQHVFQKCPLSIRKVGRENRFFHRPDSRCRGKLTNSTSGSCQT